MTVDALPAGALPFDAVVLAGGAARRMGGVDKTGLLVGSASLLERVLAAVAAASAVIVVGPVPAGPPGLPDMPAVRVRRVQEQPAGGGPAAGLAAALPLVEAPLVAVLAADLPFLTATTVRALVEAARDGAVDGALLVDPSGRDQLLAGVWWTEGLRATVPSPAAGVSVRSVLGTLRFARLPADAATCLDCDAPSDLAAARTLVAGLPGAGGPRSGSMGT